MSANQIMHFSCQRLICSLTYNLSDEVQLHTRYISLTHELAPFTVLIVTIEAPPLSIIGIVFTALTTPTMQPKHRTVGFLIQIYYMRARKFFHSDLSAQNFLALLIVSMRLRYLEVRLQAAAIPRKYSNTYHDAQSANRVRSQ